MADFAHLGNKTLHLEGICAPICALECDRRYRPTGNLSELADFSTTPAMVRVCPECQNTALGGKLCKVCGAELVDVADRAQRAAIRGVGVSIRALYAARAAMMLFWMGFVFGLMVSLGFLRRAFGAAGALEVTAWVLGGVAAWAVVWGGFWWVGNLHYRRTLAANKAATGLTGAEERFFGGESDIST